MHQHGRHIPTPPPQPDLFTSSGSRIRTPPVVRRVATPPVVRQISTPPPYEYFTPIESRMRNSPPLNPWNPYLRSYGRVYPYNIGVNPYENTPRNYVVSMRDSSPQPRSLPTYPPRVHVLPSYREYNNPSISSLPLGESMRRTLARPRSNRSFHHYRHSAHEPDTEDNPRHSSIAVIEISSDDEEDARLTPVGFTRHRDSPRCSSFIRNSANKENMLMRNRQRHVTLSPARRTPADVKPNIHAPIRPSSSEDNISSSANHYHGDDTSALNLSNRMKRPHRFSPQGSSKHCRIGSEFRRNRSHSQETTSSYSADELEQERQKPNVRELDANINSMNASTSRTIDNGNGNGNGNGNSNNSDNNVEQKFKIRIKREFKKESNTNTESNQTNQGNQESGAAVDTKEHLRVLIADIKKE